MFAGVKKPEKYIEVSLTVPIEIHDAVCNFITENVSGGIILEEKKDSDLAGITFYLPEGIIPEFPDKLSVYIKEISPDHSFSVAEIKTRIIENIEWEEAYKASVRPTVIDKVIIRPPWAKSPRGDKLDIVIEPKMAFGTGSHESTRLCVKEILEHFKPGQTFFDLGCGSGILSILAAKLGACRVRGAEIDLVAVDNALENVCVNRVSDVVEIVHGSIEKAEDNPPYDFLVANLIKSTIIELFGRINAAVRSGGIMLLSGLLIEDKDSIIETLSRNNILKYNIKQDGQWIAIRAVKR